MDNSVWVDGEWRHPDEALVSALDRAFLLGDSCFETLRFRNDKLEGKREHISLLRQSRNVLEFESGPTDSELLSFLDEAEHKLSASHLSGAVVRLTLSRGQGRGTILTSGPNLVIQIFEHSFEIPLKPLELVTSKILRNETSPLSRIKAGCYGDNLAVLREASKQGGNEALMINTKGNVAGLAMGNIVGVSKGMCVSPPPEDGVRAGFMRGQLLETARANGVAVQERSLQKQEVHNQKFVFFGLNSLWGARRIISLDGVKLSSKAQIPSWVETTLNSMS